MIKSIRDIKVGDLIVSKIDLRYIKKGHILKVDYTEGRPAYDYPIRAICIKRPKHTASFALDEIILIKDYFNTLLTI